MRIVNGDLMCLNNEFNKNASIPAGGAIGGTGNPTIDSCTFRGNRAGNGGAISMFGNMLINNSIFRENEAISNNGGAVDGSSSF